MIDQATKAARFRDLHRGDETFDGSLARACPGYLRRAADQMWRDGTFDYAEEAHSDPEINAFFASAAATLDPRCLNGQRGRNAVTPEPHDLRS